MFSEAAAWLILALPLASFLLVGLLIRPFMGSANRVAGWVTILAIGGSFILSLVALSSVVSNGPIEYPVREWISVLGFEITFGFLLDPLTAIMLVVVSGVSLLVQIYSQAYMHGDRSYARYYAYMSLFTASMLGLVTGRNVVQIFVFWELVGVSSYLLIGFWMERPTAAAAAKKAFLITRFGDFGFLLGILYLYSIDPAYLDIPALYQAAGAGLIAASAATWVALGFFMGAVGKSAQFPLHNWLPDAMEGPTPVSALIHSATMVTAGVFLIARFFPLFEASDATLLVALIGGFTAVFAASMGLVANDIKRVLAYSTISQLGYMVFALGIGAYAPAIFHLFTHAFFKAALFLGSGSVHHASGTFNMRYMGGLRKVMPYTYAGMVIASISLAGVFPLSGFWSKDEILATAFERGSGIGYLVLALGLTAAIMTAFYMFRAIFMTFHGEYRGGAEAEMEDLKNTRQEAPAVLGHTHLAESPWMMVGPIAVLAVLAIGIGFLVNPTVSLPGVERHAFSHFITDNAAVFPTHDDAVHAGAEPEFNWLIAGVSTALALGGIAIAYMMYISGAISPARLGAQFPTVYRLLIGKYYIDELYEDQVVRKGFYGTAARAVNWADGAWLDNVNVQVSAWTSRFGRGLAQVQNGQTQAYALVMAAGLVVVIAAFVAWGI